MRYFYNYNQFKVNECPAYSRLTFLLRAILEDIRENNLLEFNEYEKFQINMADWSLGFKVDGIVEEEIRKRLKKSKWINDIEGVDGYIDFNFLPPFEDLKEEIHFLYEVFESEDGYLYCTIRIDN